MENSILDGFVDIVGLAMCMAAALFALRLYRKARRKRAGYSFAECLVESDCETAGRIVTASEYEASIFIEESEQEEERPSAPEIRSQRQVRSEGQALAGGWTEKKMQAAQLAAGGLQEEEIASQLGISPVAVGLMLHAGIESRRSGGYRKKLAVHA